MADAELDALYAAVLRDPADDGTRTVWGDALLARGDPRGELVQLQLAHARGDVTHASTMSERMLIAKHGAAWAGPVLARAFDRFLFDRGVLVGCESQHDIRNRYEGRRAIPEAQPDTDAIVDDPAWATVTTASELRHIRLLVHPRGHVTRARKLHPQAAFALARAAREQPSQLVELGIVGTPSDEFQDRAFDEGFPVLATFGVSGLSSAAGFLARSSVVERVSRLHVDNLDGWEGLAAIAKRAGPLRTVIGRARTPTTRTNPASYDLGWHVELTRDAAPGKFTRARLACFVGPPGSLVKRGREILKLLANLGLRELAFAIGRDIELAPDDRRGLQAEVDALALERVDLSWTA